MKSLIMLCSVAVLFSCNSSSSKKDPNKEMDDTARMDRPPVDSITPVQPIKLEATEIPSEIKYNGQLQEAWKWNDKLGENILITSQVLPYDKKDEYGDEARSAEVHAFHYVKKGGTDKYGQLWVLNDTVADCSLDMRCEFIPGSTTVTDVDGNGIAETKVQYAVSCHGDVSPSYMQLALYENGVKHVLKGNMWIAYSPGLKYDVTENDVNLETISKQKKESADEEIVSFGRYETEKEFLTASPQFLIYAKSEWLKYSVEKMGE